MLKQLNDQNFHDEVREHDGPVVILFSGSWCGPCQSFKPTFESLSEQMKDVKFMVADIDQAPNTAQDLNIRSVPSLAVFLDGMVSEVTSGTMQKADLRLWIQDAI